MIYELRCHGGLCHPNSCCDGPHVGLSLLGMPFPLSFFYLFSSCSSYARKHHRRKSSKARAKQTTLELVSRRTTLLRLSHGPASYIRDFVIPGEGDRGESYSDIERSMC
jgi:hypothetical protein